MANMLENFGLDFFEEDENTLMGFIGYLAQEGKGITGYYGTPYLFKSMGNPEFWVKTERNEENKLEVTGVDSHCANMCVWEMIHSGIDITPKGSSKLSKTIMFNSATTHGGLIPIEIISADVLPSFMKNDKYEIQMVALPLDISYYADEEAYAEAQPSGENGEKWLVANGSLAALSFLYNHSPDRYEKDKEYESDCYVQFTATVNKLYHGTFEMNDEKNNMFIRCFVDTQFGELEFDHTLEMVPEELRDNIKVGSIITGTCILSGDVAIKEYDKGIVKDFDHNLKLLRYTLEAGDPERLASVLADDAVYDTDTSGKRFVGPQEIIDKIKYVQEHSESKYITNYATIAASENGEFPVGTRCIVLSSGESDNYESIAFIKVNYDGLITNIKISTDSTYRFEVDKPEKISTPLDDCEFPDNVAIPIINRAKFMGLIDEDVDEKSIIDNIEDYYSLEGNAQRMLSALEETPQPDVEKAFENIFGYLFAKAIEQTINEKEKKPDEIDKLLASFSIDDAFGGQIKSTLPPNKHFALEKAMKNGSKFYTDLKVFVQLKDKKEEEFVETFKQAAVIVQRIGQVYAENRFWKNE